MRFYMTCWRGDFFNHQVKNLEIKYIRETLHFSEATDDDLYNYRTLVVMMWRELRKGADESKEMDYWQAMLSLTAVIDREMYEVRGLDLN